MYSYYIKGPNLYTKRFPATKYLEKYNQSSYLDFLTNLLNLFSKFSYCRKSEPNLLLQALKWAYRLTHVS